MLQGGILSPLLFTRYIDRLIPRLYFDFYPCIFADDIAKLNSNKKHLNQTIIAVKNYCDFI